MASKLTTTGFLVWITIVGAQQYDGQPQQYNPQPQSQPQQQQQYAGPAQQQVYAAQPQQRPQAYPAAPSASPQYQSQQQPSRYSPASEPGMPYNFGWAVQDNSNGNNDYGHQEQSDGRLVTGSYRVALPDGRTQIVTYRVEGDSGFVAEVRYEGQAQFPQPSSSGSSGYSQQQQYSQGNNNEPVYPQPQKPVRPQPQQY